MLIEAILLAHIIGIMGDQVVAECLDGSTVSVKYDVKDVSTNKTFEALNRACAEGAK